MNILIIEDDELLAKKIKDSFDKKCLSNRVTITHSYIGFLSSLWIIKSFDIMIVDIKIWDSLDKTWLDIIKTVRTKKINIPIVVLSSFSDYQWIKNAFDSWANDYFIKPIRLKELEIRVFKWFRMHFCSVTFNDSDSVKYNSLDFIIAENEFYYEWIKVNLSRLEKYILSIFISRNETLLKREFLEEKIWWDIVEIENRNLRIVILRLKQKLRSFWIDERIQNVRGEWYIFKKN